MARALTNSRRLLGALLALLAAGASGASRTAAADEPGGGAAPDVEATSSAQSAPPAPRVLHVPTAWLQHPGRLYGTTGINHRGGTFLAVSGGLGRLAEFDVNISDRFVRCDRACVADSADGKTDQAFVGSALFKIGTAENSLFAGQPALALGFRKSFYMTEDLGTDTEERRFAELYAVASRHVGSAALHVGAQLFDVKLNQTVPRLLDVSKPQEKLRPFGGLEWVPHVYPRTTLLLDFSWVPRFEERGEADSQYYTELRWVAGWGVRYQALTWGSIELAVRHRQDEGLSDSTVFVRMNGTLDYKEWGRARAYRAAPRTTARSWRQSASARRSIAVPR